MSTPLPQLEIAPNGRLVLLDGKQNRPVRAVRCFPWSEPDAFLSLRDDEGRELALIRHPDELDEASARALRSVLQETGHTFEILSIYRIEKEIELRCWDVETSAGRRLFQTELDVWPEELPDGRFLVRDVCGDLYTIRPLEELDPESQKPLWVLVS